MTKQYALFLGCFIPYRLPHMEAAARAILKRFGVGLATMNGAGCCPDPTGFQSLDHTTWLALAARNLLIAEEMDMDVITLCNGCFETLKTASVTLRTDHTLRKEINEILSKIGKEFKGRVRVKHLSEVLCEEVGVQRIKENIVRSLEGVKAAVHPGCHMISQSNITKFDDPEISTYLDQLVEATGAESVGFTHKMLCCGAGISVIDRESNLRMVREKLVQVQQVGADCIVLICPSCFLQYDLGQIQLSRLTSETFRVPILYYPEMLGLALGISPEELGLGLHKIKVNGFLEKVARSH